METKLTNSIFVKNPNWKISEDLSLSLETGECLRQSQKNSDGQAVFDWQLGHRDSRDRRGTGILGGPAGLDSESSHPDNSPGLEKVTLHLLHQPRQKT